MSVQIVVFLVVPLHSLGNGYAHFRRTWFFCLQSTKKMEEVLFLEMFMSTSKSIQCHNPEFDNLNNINKKYSELLVSA